ncbi:hypothetical protein HKX48_001140 [Thoreauomyces humboldtii]|nr:hypothetical protein HKX48_001140 [Thoreauomyces humboldtii]
MAQTSTLDVRPSPSPASASSAANGNGGGRKGKPADSVPTGHGVSVESDGFIPGSSETDEDPKMGMGNRTLAHLMPRRQSWSDTESISDERHSTPPADRPGPGLMLRKVPSFSALRAVPPPATITSSASTRSTLAVRHNPLPAAHHATGPYLPHYHPHHLVQPPPLPVRNVSSQALSTPYTNGRTSAVSETSRRLSKFKSGESLKSFMGVSSDGERDRELVVETDAALQGVGRPPLFKSATLPCRPTSKGKGDEDFEEFVWSGSPDPQQSRNRRSFSTHLAPAPNPMPSSMVPVSASQRAELSMSDYITPPSMYGHSGGVLDSLRYKTQGPSLKKSTDFRAPPKRSGQPAAPYLPVSHSQYSYGHHHHHYLDDSSPEHGSPTYGSSGSGGAIPRAGEGSSYLHDYSMRQSFEEERAYLLRAKRRDARARTNNDNESMSDFSRPRPRSFLFALGIILFLLLGVFTVFTFCIQPLSQLTMLSIADIRPTYSSYDFDVVFAAANENIVPIYLRNVDLDVFVGGDLIIDQKTDADGTDATDDSDGRSIDSNTDTSGTTTGGRPNTESSSSKELLAHVRHLTTAINFPALTPSTQTTPIGHVSIREPENTLGKL